ncbi:RluA family pseudouridine synthase [Caldinitratiruptor microaerophilus]|uniref:Pseudouridine synthase n=1 Tax=Caldinitratiruptor microaerophilus TaxID=671077 RepID=A0AA35G8R7_9FIRM|nr:RluA family pseudouridine synthase [Caldinitratiruptor microaerophilus]BDG60723.1 putative RNA pseudouridine synthase YlyB [Caldinitratiruptor microaerophilus]
MTQVFRFRAGEADAGQRLDVFLAAQPEPGLSRARIQALIRSGRCRVGGRPARAGQRLSPGDEVVLEVPPPEAAGLVPEDIPLDVVYRDEDVLVVNKPRGLVVHPAAGHARGTLANTVAGMAAWEDGEDVPGDPARPGIVHRLDKDTTGLLVVALNPQAHQRLAEQVQRRALRREYLAIVHGSPPVESGRIEAPVGRHPTDRKRMAVTPGRGREAITHFRVLERYRGFSLVQCRLETGRTHQIRVHLAYIGHPVAGDPVYGPRRQALGLTAQALHAFRLGFVHPRTGEWLQFEVPPPEDMARAIEALRRGEAGEA